jgi:hypothetical protein
MTIVLDKITEFNQRVFRNIQGIPLELDEFDDLTDDVVAKAYAHRVSSTYLPRNKLQYNAIDYIFKQSSWSISRFSNGRYPVWYGSINLETSIHETIFHWRRTYLDAPLIAKPR